MNERTAIKVYSTFYNDLTHLRAAITAIPFIGSQIDLYLSSPGQKFVEERLTFMINELQQEMNEIQETAIDIRILDTEEGFDLVFKTFTAAAKTRQKEKLKLFAKILKGSFIQQQTKFDPELYLKIVDELSIRELEVALLLYDVKEKKKIKGDNEAQKGSTNDAFWFSKNYPQFSKDELEFILPRLEKTGLIKELIGSFIGYGGGLYFPSPIFKDLMVFIENHE